ncbi:uncharacterized protein Dwil_GK11524 [Drosophila willistoni]|uniref:Uncharacterized protein n=1 Tax=Drosophila willistoni TaxID=7260 RepID=B4N915_DROWI|nr:inactive hydroxysteroid dehydrogenase-like protein 1 [Drosophila willistoni]EDW80520.1 uncharacterized protein Dwil_GK11524 [Drosophila willistoni]
MSVIYSIVFYIGALAILNFLYDNFISLFCIIFASLKPYFIPKSPKGLVEKYGKWAVVTGATDGIGKEYAKELARQGLNIVLVSRTQAKLELVASEIENETKVQTKVIIVDFTKGREIYEHIENELADIDVGILVNNVGVVTDHPDYFDLIPESKLWDIINVNMASLTILTRKILPKMKASNKGAIINVGSGSEMTPQPLLSTYAASKKYVSSFTYALQREVAKTNVTVQLVKPNFVKTNMNAYSKTVMEGGFFMADARSYARAAVCTIGKTNDTNAFWVHSMQYFVMKMVPWRILMRVSQYVLGKLRKEALVPK